MFYKIPFKLIVIVVIIVLGVIELTPIATELYEEYESTNIQEALQEEMPDKVITENDISQAKINYFIGSVVVVLINSIFLVGLKYYWLWFILLGFYLGRRKFIKTKLNKNDFNHYQGYFREILSKYSVDVLSYIDQFQFRYPSILVAMLLQLKQKNFITIEEEKIIKNDFTTTPNCSEEYLLNHIENGILNVSKSQFESQTLKSAVEEKLLKSDEFSKNTFQRFVLVSFILFMVAFLCLFAFSFILDNNIQLILFLIGFLSFIIVMIYLPIKIISWIVYVVHVSHNPGVRTKKGEEINLRLEGLKNFLKDFSTLDQKTQEQLVLWDEYLIYSVLFEQNEKIVSEYMKYIKIS